MKPAITIICCGAILAALVWVGGGPYVAPEMEECLRSHHSQAHYAAVLKKYCSPAMAQKAMGLLVVKEPEVINTKRIGRAVCYEVEGSVADTAALAPDRSVQDYAVCWENGRLISLDFKGSRPMAR